jgi:hypothetical protein
MLAPTRPALARVAELSVLLDSMSDESTTRLEVIGQMSDERLTSDPFDDDAAIPWHLSDDVYPGDEAEEASWARGLPHDVGDEYEHGPYTGDGEAIPAGFTHRDGGGPTGAGFAAGGAWDRAAPGWSLARALTDVTGNCSPAGYQGLGESELIGVQRAWQRTAAWSAATAELARRRGEQAVRQDDTRVIEHTADEVAAALTLTNRSANRLLEVSRGLSRLPAVYAALAAGLVDWARACVFVDELAVVHDDEAARQLADKALSRAEWRTTSQLRYDLRRLILDYDPEAAAARKQAARKDTRVEIWDEPSGNSVLAGRELAPADAIAADSRLTADGQWLRDNGVPGTLAELRAMAFMARLTGKDLATLVPPATASTSSDATDTSPGAGSAADPSGAGPGAANPRPGTVNLRGTVSLTMPLSTFDGQSQKSGEAAGYGPQDAETCRDLASRMGDKTRWCLTLTDEDGRAVAHACARHGPDPGQPAIKWAVGLRRKLQYLETGSCSHARESTQYRPPDSLAHLVRLRQRTCAAPCCRRPATACDLDHTVPYDQGGRTCECGLAPLCRHHHRAKQAPGWHLVQDEPGHMAWTLPHRRSYITTGELYPI